jgi:phage tail P2-like protein
MPTVDLPENFSLLPPNASDLELAVEGVGLRVDALPVNIRDLWNPETCPMGALPWLAWMFSVDEWDARWSVDQKRGVVSGSIEVHRHKGTLWAVKRALAAAGYGDAVVTERFGWQTYDGSLNFDGAADYVQADHWAEYRLQLARPISIAQAAQVRAILDSTAPAHCRLKALDFTEALNLYDGALLFDGSYTHGVA